MFTPQEVQEKVFPKASGIGNGYQMAAVDQFLDTLTEDYTAVYKENVTLKSKLKVLADKIEEYRATEDSMRATLLTAQKMAAKLVQEAQAEHDSLVADAKKDAAEEMAQLEAQIKAEEQKLQMAQKSSSEFISKSMEMLRAQALFFEGLAEMKNTPAVSAAAPAAVPAAAPMAEPVESAPDSSEVPEEVRAEAPAQEFEGAQFADLYKELEEDISLSLDELKFGRNYEKKD